MKCIHPRLIWPHRSIEWQDKHEEYPMQVPCGKCMACLSNSRSEWVFRLEQELKYSTSAVFVTLTYDQKHLRTDQSLCKRDLQLYMKRLRKLYGNVRIRYFGVGEYGGVSGRPHYHLLLFNATDRHVREAWCDSKGCAIGIVHVGTVTQASISYCTKYIVQPSVDLSKELEAPFRLMSRAFGIGGRYLSDAMVAWHRNNDANYCVRDREKVRLSRFYKSKIWYSEESRERITKLALKLRLDADRKSDLFWSTKYGVNWREKYIEMRDAMLGGISKKVAFSQSI